MGNHQHRKFSHILVKGLDRVGVFFVAGWSFFGWWGSVLLYAGHAAISKEKIRFLIFGEMWVLRALEDVVQVPP